MKRILAALSMAAMTAAPFSASAAPAANTLTYAGYMAKPGGAAETGTVSVTFRLYDVATGGTALWTEVDGAITPGADGWFSTTLGDGTPFPATVDFSQQLYLGIQVGTELEMAPRIKLANAPRALSAEWTALNGIPAPCSGATPVLQGFTATGTAVCAASAAPTWAALTGFPAACSGATPVLTGFAANGSALCAADNVGLGTLTGLTVGSGLTGGGSSGSVAVALTTCTPGQILKFNGGVWGCAADDTGTSNPGTVTTVSAGPASVVTVATPTTTPAITINQAGSASDGYLSSADWTAFNSKLGNGTGTVSGANILDGTITGADIAGCAAYGMVLKWDGMSSWFCGTDNNTVTGLGTSGNLTLDAAGTLDTSANPTFSTVTATNFYGIADAAYLAYSTSTGSVVPSSLSTAATPSAGQVPADSGLGYFNWITPLTSVTAGTGLTGGTITTSGTIGVDFAGGGSATTVARSDHSHPVHINVPMNSLAIRSGTPVLGTVALSAFTVPAWTMVGSQGLTGTVVIPVNAATPQPKVSLTVYNSSAAAISLSLAVHVSGMVPNSAMPSCQYWGDANAALSVPAGQTTRFTTASLTTQVCATPAPTASAGDVFLFNIWSNSTTNPTFYLLNTEVIF